MQALLRFGFHALRVTCSTVAVVALPQEQCLSGKFAALDARMASHVLDMRAVHEVLVRRLEHVDQRVSALEAGFVDRRRRD